MTAALKPRTETQIWMEVWAEYIALLTHKVSLQITGDWHRPEMVIYRHRLDALLMRAGQTQYPGRVHVVDMIVLLADLRAWTDRLTHTKGSAHVFLH